jgi:hypothetical protein
MSGIYRRDWLIVAAPIAIFCAAVAIFNVWLTNYIESEQFRTALENETAEGLHFPGGRYGPIRRTGFLTATSEHFQAQDGCKAMQALGARDIHREV